MRNEKDAGDFKQIPLFSHDSQERVLMRVRLESESALSAWYELALVSTPFGYLVEKTSGAQGRGHQSETWYRRNLPDAEKKYSRILSDKVNPKRRSPRKYRVVLRETQIFN
jgi:hypothetical protein